MLSMKFLCYYSYVLSSPAPAYELSKFEGALELQYCLKNVEKFLQTQVCLILKFCVEGPYSKKS